MLSDKEKSIVEEALMREGDRGLTSHQAYLLIERNGITKGQVAYFLKSIGKPKLVNGKPKKVGVGKAIVYVYDDVIPDWEEKRAERESRWIVETAKKYDT